MKHKTCVSIAESSPVKLEQTLKTALKKSDYVEIRFDFLKAEKIPKVLESVKKIFKKFSMHLATKKRGRKI